MKGLIEVVRACFIPVTPNRATRLKSFGLGCIRAMGKTDHCNHRTPGAAQKHGCPPRIDGLHAHAKELVFSRGLTQLLDLVGHRLRPKERVLQGRRDLADQVGLIDPRQPPYVGRRRADGLPRDPVRIQLSGDAVDRVVQSLHRYFPFDRHARPSPGQSSAIVAPFRRTRPTNGVLVRALAPKGMSEARPGQG